MTKTGKDYFKALYDVAKVINASLEPRAGLGADRSVRGRGHGGEVLFAQGLGLQKGETPHGCFLGSFRGIHP